MAGRGRDVDCPVAGAADIGVAPSLKRLIGAEPFAALVVMLAAGRADQFAKLVIEPFRCEIALLLGNPFLQPKCGSMMNLAMYFSC